MSRIDVEPIREAVEAYIRNGGTWTTICRNLGFIRSDGKPESSNLKVMLGITPNSKGKLGKRVSYENAVQIVLAIGRDPVEFGL